jgi:hypothetical protein
VVTRKFKIWVLKFGSLLAKKQMREKIAVGFNEGLIVAEDDSAELTEFGLINFHL